MTILFMSKLESYSKDFQELSLFTLFRLKSAFQKASNLILAIVVFYALQLPLSFMTMLINLYCIVCILVIKKLRTLDFFLVGVQTLVDLLFSGALCFAFFYSQAYEAVRKYCKEKRYFDNDNHRQNGIDYERLNLYPSNLWLATFQKPSIVSFVFFLS